MPVKMSMPAAGSTEPSSPPVEESSTGGPLSSNDLPSALNVHCSVCREPYTTPKVLDCFHTCCAQCLERSLSGADCPTVACPDCSRSTQLPAPGAIDALPDDIAVVKYMEATAMVASGSQVVHCTGCIDKDSEAMSQCFECANFLCANCVKAHKFMHCFETHRVEPLAEVQAAKAAILSAPEKLVPCPKHTGETLKLFCKDCMTPICPECANTGEHKKHQHEYLADCIHAHVNGLRQLITSAKVKVNALRSAKKGIEHCNNKLQSQFDSAKGSIKKTADYCRTLIEEQQQSLVKELEHTFKSKENILTASLGQTNGTIDQLYQGCEFLEKLLGYADPVEILLLFKLPLEAKMKELMQYQVDTTPVNPQELSFVSNSQAIRTGIKNTFGYVKQDSREAASPVSMQQPPQPIARPGGVQRHPIAKQAIPNGTPFEPPGLSVGKFGGSSSSINSLNGIFMDAPTSQGYDVWSTGMEAPGPGAPNGVGVPGLNHHHAVPPGPGGPHHGGPPSAHDLFPIPNGVGGGPGPGVPNGPSGDGMCELTGKLISTNLYPPKSQIKRQKMIYHCKFGEFGVNESQFTEPSGVAVNAQNDIIVADTNNHRIQIFDKEGRFKFQFGQCGKLDGQLLYPNRVAVVKRTGDIVVTERSPTHQVQIFSQYGQFVKKFGANVLQHPRGVTVDYKSQIIIVECKVMRVIIFDMYGNVLQKFGCSKHLEFPNGVVVNDKQEIFISDNRAHCVKVFSYQGQYLRQIGGEGISNYPIGVGINALGEVLIADNHNNFNLTVFTQDGQILHALESKVKHAQCFDVALLDEGSIVLASKDYRLYIYRYAQPAPPPPHSAAMGAPYGSPFVNMHDPMPNLKLDPY